MAARHRGAADLIWLIVGVGLLLAFGPILWLMPSKRDRQQAKLRAAARRCGLVVELSSVPRAAAPPEERVSAGGVRRTPTIPCAAYALPRADGHLAPSWLLCVGDGRGPMPGWVFGPDGGPRDLPTDAKAYWRRVAVALDGAQARCLGVAAGAAATTWYWRENAGADAAEAAAADIARRLAIIAAAAGADGG